jgi:hypothetical protein
VNVEVGRMRRRALGRRWRRYFAGALLAISGGGVLWAMSADAGPSREPAALARHAVLKVRHVRTLSQLGPPLAVLQAGDLVEGRGAKRIPLGGGDEVIAALTGSLIPVAVQSNDHSLVAYASWHQIAALKPDEPGQGVRVGDPIGVSSVRLYDAAVGKDKLVATGAYSPALSVSGELAFVKGDDTIVRANRDYTGQVVVGAAPKGPFTQWTSDAARYFTYAWADGTLLVYRALPDSEATDLYALMGPSDGRLLAADATAVALSPDASRVLITVGRRMVEVVRIADGAVERSLALDGPTIAAPGSSTTPHALMYSGSWSGGRVVANSDAGLVVLNVKDGLRIESIFKTRFPHGIIEPTFTDDTHIIGWADLAPVSIGKDAEPAYEHALVSCDLLATTCAVGPSQPARKWTRWITNPSR